MQTARMNLKKQKNITLSLLVTYLIVLTWIILFKMETDFSILKSMNLRNINLIPFSSPLIVNGQVDISEIILNIAAFVPFGIYLSILKEKWSFTKKGIPIFGVSLAFETFQYILAIGASDITDLIGNTLGGMIGILVFTSISYIFGDRTLKIVNGIALIGTIIMVAFIGLLMIINM
ncbi:VanZ family protein [Paenibacillus dakarensis]|uniref:VanZ family protein n=1 Tax=Paenibacillus dakarensis TaxID=1527293 RepID=UPI0006D5A44B|nr:VanZ family protein [Paenibacillus dakarensis]